MIETAQQSIPNLVAQGLQFHQRGDLARAEQVYLAVLMREPQNGDALHLMGSVRGRQGLTAEGIRLMEQAIEANPRVSIYHNNLGNLKAAVGDVAGAEQSYRQAIKIDRRNASAHLNLGKLLEGRSQPGKAHECYIASLRLDSRLVEAHMSLGRLEESEGKARAALQSYSNALRIDPKYAAGHLAAGNAQVKLKALDRAEESYRTAIELDPTYGDALFNLANTVHEQGRLEEALEWHRRAAALPGSVAAEAWNNAGLILSELDRHDEAEAAFRRAIELRPDFDDALFNLGKALTMFGDRAAGMEMLRKAIAINPRNASAHLQLGTALHAEGFLHEAILANRKALELDPTCRITRRNLGMMLAHVGDTTGLDILEAMVRESPESVYLRWTWSNRLLLHGRYEEGWREYEWRIQVEDMKSQHREFDVPRWTGEALAGKRILLYSEQGYGDAVQFARYAALVAERGGTVILEVYPGLKRWCAALPGVTECIAYGDPLPQFDTFAPLMSLPHILGTGGLIPPPVAPRFNNPPRAGVEGSRKLWAGVVWAGNSKHILDGLRSTRLTEWSGLAKIEGVEFISLQVGDAAAQIDEGGHGFSFAADCRSLRDFTDTAAVIAGLDLVITVDTAVAHIAASMGKPVWILLYTMVDWRWGLEKDSSVWYPSARLFRQRTPGSWSGVFAEVEGALRDLAASR